MSSICLIDTKNTLYEFNQESGVISINKKPQGKGKLVTPIANVSLQSNAVFSIGRKQFKTGSLKGCIIQE